MRYVSPRDVILVLIGAGSMYFASLFTLTSPPEPAPPTLILNSQYPPSDAFDQLPDPVQDIARPGAAKHHHHPDLDAPLPDPPRAPTPPPLSKPKPASPPVPIPETTLVQHAPGWTIFENVYMSNGTILVVTDHPEDYPATEYITSTGLYAWNTPESIQERLPTPQEIDFISPAQARERWGDGARGEDVRVFPVVGDTLLFNDPDQFLNHYYHFCAELFFGAWAVWTGTYTADTPSTFTRAIFPHTGRSWRDNPHMNAFFLRGAFPSITVETEEDWADRADATRPLSSGTGDGRARAYHFDRMLLVDRSASFRGPECGSRTQRTASEAMRAVVPKNADGTSQREFLPRGWWEPVRRRVLSFAGVPSSTLDLFNAARPDAVPSKDRTVLTYISRQAVRRRLVPEDHERLVDALEALCRKRGWEFVLMQAERLSREEQLVIAARTTYLVGVHGNGLSHLIMMPPTPAASVFEIFFPEGYAHDYEWTARSLGMRHFAIWNDTSKTFPEVTWPNYPEGFQGTSIPVWGPYVAQLIEDRADGKV